MVNDYADERRSFAVVLLEEQKRSDEFGPSDQRISGRNGKQPGNRIVQ